MSLYLASFLATVFFSTLFATGGMGSSIVLIPILTFLGIDFNLAKATGLFVNTVTTSTASFMNWRRQKLDFRLLVPFVLCSVLSAPAGAYCAQIWDVDRIKLAFAVFLLLVAAMMFTRTDTLTTKIRCGRLCLIPLGLCVGFLAGLLGIGGGALIVPALFAMRFPSREIAVNLSFMIPFSTFSAFLSYAGFIAIDWTLIAVTTAGALIGGIAGNRIMHGRLQDRQIKMILALALCLVALKLLSDLMAA